MDEPIGFDQYKASLAQTQLYATRSQAERNRRGQYATPTDLAADIMLCAKPLLRVARRISFLDPAFGIGTFYAALLRAFPRSQIEKAWGYEIDSGYVRAANGLWQDSRLCLRHADFTKVVAPTSDEDKANLVICNPPYVRHHHLTIEDKTRLRARAKEVTGIELNGFTGLYCYFLLLSHEWMAEDGLAGWLIPSEFMDANYGQPVRHYLTHCVTLLHVHRFDPTDPLFPDALVSSSLVWFRKTKPRPDHKVRFSYGSSLLQPAMSDEVSLANLQQLPKWTRLSGKASSLPILETECARVKLSDLFRVKRGLATGAKSFFVLTPEQVLQHGLPSEFLFPILPSPRYLPADEIAADTEGNPLLDRPLYLLDCHLPEDEIRDRYPGLWHYLQTGVQQAIHKRYLCRHRSLWYGQESRPPTQLLCTYMGRRSSSKSTPFRFILNHSRATASNVYLMLYPIPALEESLARNPELLRAMWQGLNDILHSALGTEGRVYGGGLYKIEPGELAAMSVDSLLTIIPEDILR